MGFWAFLARRIALAFLVLVIVSIATFSLAHAIPGDPIALVLGDRQADNPEVRAALERRWGFDKPLPLQYVYYIGNLFQGDWGESITARTPVAQELRERVPATIELSVFALGFAVITGVPLGIIAALNHDRWPDHLSRLISLLGTSIPVFWLGLLLLYVFFYQLKWLPGPGRLDVGMRLETTITGIVTLDAVLQRDWDVLRAALKRLILPSIVLGSFSMGIVSRMLRSSLLASLGDDYVRTARAKGLEDRAVVVNHALRNALIPTITILGLTMAGLLAGAVLTETIFSWPGIGQFAVAAALRRDYPALMGVTLIVAVIYIVVNLLVDVAYGLLDPRIRST
jgi:peptide/nickel transport system permease protein